MQAAIAALREALQGSIGAPEGLIEDEYRVVLPDGAVRWIAARVRVVYGPDRRPARLLAVNFDLTNRKPAAVTLKLSEERFRLASEALAGFLYEWNPTTNDLEWFGGTEQVMGFSLAEVTPDVGWYERRVHPDDLPGAWAGARQALQSGASGYANVYRFLHRDGHYVTVADRGRIVRDETGRPIRVFGGVSDISERRRLEREREELLHGEREARAAAEGAVRARDELLGIVSHDLRSSVDAVAICAAALSEAEDSPPAERQEILQALQRATAWMNRLTRNLLDATSIEAGRLAIQLHDAAPAALIAEAAERFAPVAQQRGIVLHVQTRADLPTILVDGERILEALSNLLSNALTFTETGGRVTLEVDRAPEGICFAVKDTGAGIPAENLPHVFDRYWEKHDRSGGHGTGLGLAIVEGIVDAHGGGVRAESTLGEGSRFSFTIPTAR
jgi:PAS domain S-box-containing protein